MSTELKEEDLHYLGGMMDGDGCFSVRASKHRKRSLMSGFSIRPYIGIEQVESGHREFEVRYDGRFDLHYLAGVLDAEGCFTISVVSSGKCEKGQIWPVATLHMVKERNRSPVRELIVEYADSVGVELYVRDRIERDAVSSDTWEATATHEDSLRLMRDLRPYLRLKQHQVDQILAVDWDSVHDNRENFLKAVKASDRLRESRGTHNESKYTYEYFVEEWSLDEGQKSAAGGEAPSVEIPDPDPPELEEVEETETQTVNSAADW